MQFFKKNIVSNIQIVSRKLITYVLCKVDVTQKVKQISAI